MRVWAVANQKGGVGKTTTTVALGGLLAAAGARTLLVDMDPHASLTSYFGFDAEALPGGVYDLFRAGAADAPPPAERILPTRFERLAVLPATPAMATLDRQLGARAGMGLALAEALATLADDYDRVLVDCPPMLGVLMVNALAACERLVIPTQTEFLALNGLERMLRSLAMIERARGMRLPRLIVPTLYDGRTHASAASLRALRERHADELAQSVIPVDTQIREASLAGVPAGAWPAARRGAQAYRGLLDELLAQEAPLALEAAS
ncbi:cobyrinic acid ac-diamide synthase [Mizugakiibacter sediminis]|uniref:Cobyrinic acid ac-diamide synthase n=2 Tax=Mizugakiibacter sediminis TaxID=1475481 RepID=A0A0K8QPE4_9GAMM|nr:cobyrinic acid ac-diamide synthase [Mizugakiibacter sediminis]